MNQWSLMVRNGLAALLIILVCSRSIGYIADLPTLSKFGYDVISSPLPVPFRDFGPYENYVVTPRLTIWYSGGQSTSTVLDKASNSRVSAPHKYKLFGYFLFNYTPLIPYQTARKIGDYVVCTKTWFTDGADADSYKIEMISRRSDAVVWEKTYVCNRS